MHDDEGEVVTTVFVGTPPEQVGPLEQCPTCRRYIDRVCSVCPPPERARTATPEEARRRHEELREQSRRERDWYERGRR